MRMLFVFIAISLMQVQPIHTDYQNLLLHSNDPTKSEHFRNVDVTGKNNIYVVTGEIRSNIGEFYYIVEDGHNELITETEQKVNVSQSQWSKFSFKLTLQKEKIPENGTVTLYLFVKNSEGKRLQIYPFVLHANPYNKKS